MSKKIRTPNNVQAVSVNGVEHGRELVAPMQTSIIPAHDPVLDMIDRAAHSPDVSVEKLNALFDLRLRMMEKKDEMEFNAAMNRVQSSLRRVAPDLYNNQTKSKYASFAAMEKVVRPQYAAEGFALSFNEGETPLAEHVRALCYVTRGAYTRTYHMDMPCDGKGAKGGDVMTKTHARSTAMSYAMRNLLKFIFAVAIGEDDTDGNSPEPLSEEQAIEIEMLIKASGADESAFLSKVMHCDSVRSIQQRDFSKAKSQLTKKFKIVNSQNNDNS